MSLYFASLASGSNGNCYYIGNSHEAVLIDAGISCRETEKRMARLGLSIQLVRAIFISHEHTDHTNGARMLSNKHNIPVYISEPTNRNRSLNLDEKLKMPLLANWPVEVGGLKVKAFPKMHDACDPLSFTVSGGGSTVGVFTDIGSICENVAHNFSQCHAAFLETNYDEEMLEQSRYPAFLKKRIKSDHGHLSNLQSLELLNSHRSPFLTHLLFSHLSQDNNDPQKVLALFSKHANGIQLEIASRQHETKLYQIGM